MTAFIPYGKLPNGQYGLRLENGTSVPLASVIEVIDSLPSISNSDNFPGRTMFSRTEGTLYVFVSDPSPSWISLDGIPAEIGNVNGIPPTSPTPPNGKLYFDKDTEVLFVWDATAWQPVGGRYAATIKQQYYVADGFDTTFSMGTTAPVTSEYTEVFMDGIKQYPNPSGDYNVVGTNIVFNTSPPNGVKIYIRSFESEAIVQNAQIARTTYTASNGDTDFSVGQPGLDPSGVFVFKNGILQVLSTNYTYDQQNTNITTLTKTSPTNARATTLNAHNLSVGFVVTLFGITENYYNNQTFVVSATPSSTQFDFTVLSSAPASATGSPIMYFTPPYRNDVVEFTTPMTGGEQIEIRALKHVVVAPSTGEANTIASIGSGTSLSGGKAGTTLQVKSLVAGANVSITNNSSEVTIGVNNAAGFEDYISTNSAIYAVTNESFVGVRNTSLPVTINLSGITGAGNSGRKITVMDESGGATSNNISVITGGPSIDGGSSSYVINTNYGCVTMIFNGSDWFVISEKV